MQRFLFVLCLLSLVAIVLAGRSKGGTPYCGPRIGISEEKCKIRIKRCAARGIILKWGAIGCKDSRGRLYDGGCQCDKYCGYHCPGSCNEDNQCRWDFKENVCKLKPDYITGGVPVCPMTFRPTFAPTFSCFHQESTAQLESGETIRLNQLKYGDSVMVDSDKSGNPIFSKIITFTGYYLTSQAEAVVLHFNNVNKLASSSGHLIFASNSEDELNGKYYRADEIKVGMFIWHNFQPTMVIKRTSEKMTGFISPLTETGTILVNGVSASCHTQGPHELIMALYKPYVLYLQLFPETVGEKPIEEKVPYFSQYFRKGLLGKVAYNMMLPWYSEKS